jgi:putative ABC transport system permease protein
MARATRTGLTRLVEVRALTGDFPYYGRIDTDPPGGRGTLEREAVVLADSAVLVALQIAVGDSLAIGDARFPIAAALVSVPGEIGILTALGPRVYIPGRSLEATNLLRFGSRATYFAYLQLPAGEVEPFIERHRELFGSQGVGFDSAAEREEELTESLAMLARYLGLVGLIALLLGGIGVASAAHVFMKDRLRTAAILRCLGATSRIVFVTYLLQAALLGLVGAALGAGLGLVVQSVLPGVFREFLPLRVTTHIHWPTVFVGVGAGVWVAAVVALRPLLAAARVPALAALRRDVVERPWRSRLATALVGLVLAATVVALSVWQAPTRLVGYFFAGGVLVTTLVLWLVALLLIAVTRRAVPRRAPFVLRQGIGNLFRPQNQTVAVTLAVGFGVFLLGTLAVVQENLLGRLALNTAGDRPNLVLFDIQHDQRDGVEQIVRARGLPVVGTTPIVPSRIARLEGRPVDSVLADTLRGVPRSRWALRREYRNTYRATVADGERMVAGVWWDGDGRERPAGSSPAPDDPARISLEEDLAGELNVQVGDRITWDVQGRMIESVVTSLRRVDWVRFEPNFFVVFEPGVLEEAPQTYVTLTRAGDAVRRAELQRDVVTVYPNVSAVDLSLVQDTLDRMIGSVALAVRFMASFCIASGIMVLVGAAATTRFQRLRESALLRTLGARSRQIMHILFAEYFALGSLAACTGVGLAVAASWALVRFLFELRFSLPSVSLGMLWLAAVMLTTAVGMLAGRRTVRESPLVVIRETAE